MTRFAAGLVRYASSGPLLAMAALLVISQLGSAAAAEPAAGGELHLQGGGWISGFAAHANGRIYSHGESCGVFRSDDFGASWQFAQRSMADNGNVVFGLAVSCNDSDHVAFSGQSALWTSSDGGDSWVKSLGDLIDIEHSPGSRPLIAHPTRADEVWFAGNRDKYASSLWRSVDQGRTWREIGADFFNRERATTIAISAADPDEIWVGTNSIGGKSATGGLWCSSDNGLTWRKVWDHGGAAKPYEQSVKVNSIARTAARVSVIATTNGIWQITATTWGDPRTYVATPVHGQGQEIANVTALVNGDFWASSSGDAAAPALFSADGSTWAEQALTLSDHYVPDWSTKENIGDTAGLAGRDALIQDPKNPKRLLLSGAISPLLSEDGGHTWRYQPGDMPATTSWNVDFDASNPERAYVATARGIFVLSDGGASGFIAASSTRILGGAYCFHETMVSGDGRTIVAAGVDDHHDRSVIIRSRDGGVSWETVAPHGLPGNFDGITRSVMSPTDPDDFLVLLGSRFGHTGFFHDMQHGGQQNSPGLYRTTDGGATFVRVGGFAFDDVILGTRTTPEDAFLMRDGVDASVRYLMLRASHFPAAEGLWRSHNGGSTWAQLGVPGVGWNFSAFAVDPAIAGRLWAGGDILRRSDDGGVTWHTVPGITGVGSISAVAQRIAVLGYGENSRVRLVYLSVDDGVTWHAVTDAQKPLANGRQVISDPWRPGHVWIADAQSVHLASPPFELPPLLSGHVSDGGNSLDLGDTTHARITMIRYLAGSDATQVVGGRFESSLDGRTWTTLATIVNLSSAAWQTLPAAELGCFRFLRYRAPAGAGALAKIEFRGLVASLPRFADAPRGLAGFVGEPLNVKLACSGFPAPTFIVARGHLALGLTFDAQQGIISGTPKTPTYGELMIEARNVAGEATAQLQVDIVGGPRLRVNAPARHIQPIATTDTLTLDLANPGDTPLVWSLTSPKEKWILSVDPVNGTLAPGMTATVTAHIDSSNLVDGSTQSAEIAISCNDLTRRKRSVALTVVVGQRPDAPVIEPGQTGTTWQGGTFRQALRASGKPTSWSLVAGALPDGLVLDQNGMLSGSPHAPGVSVLTVEATNDGGTSQPQPFTLTIAPPAPGTAYDFNAGQADFEEKFNCLGFIWKPWIGIGGTGGLVTDMNDRSGVSRTPTITFDNPEESITVGVSFQAKNAESTAGGINLTIGLSSHNVPPLMAHDYLAASINGAEGPEFVSAIAVDARAGDKKTGAASERSQALINKHWYRLEAVITHLGDGRFLIKEQLGYLGADGTAQPQVILANTRTLEGLSGLVHVPLYAGFRGFNCIGWGGVYAMDDFSACTHTSMP